VGDLCEKGDVTWSVTLTPRPRGRRRRLGVVGISTRGSAWKWFDYNARRRPTTYRTVRHGRPA